MEYKALADLYESLSSTSKRLDKTETLAEFIKGLPADSIKEAMLLLQGTVFYPWDKRELGVASKLMIKAIGLASGASEKKIVSLWKKLGDLGDVATELLSKKKQTSLFDHGLSVKRCFSRLQELAGIEGSKSTDKKLKIISGLLVSASSIEAKYLVRTILGDLRVGLGKGTIRDAIIWAHFSKELGIRFEEGSLILDDDTRKRYSDLQDRMQLAYDLSNDYPEIIRLIREKGMSGLDEIHLKIFFPVNAMLYQKAKDIEDAFSIVGKPAAFEYKYDGFRLQIHKSGDKIRLYTRRLEDVTDRFPEVVDYIRELVKAKSCILDAEAVGFDSKTGRYLPFQAVSQRIRRKYDIRGLAEQLPVEVHVFDILRLEDDDMIHEPFLKRRKAIERIIKPQEKKIVLAKQLVTDDAEKAKKFYQESLDMGEEGVMVKNLDAVYKPGSRVGYGVKVKPVMEPLDLVIVSAEYGEGKRSGWLTSYTLACWDENHEELLEIGKVSTGLKELKEEGVSFDEMTTLLSDIIVAAKGKEVRVEPKIVIEVKYEEIQKSSTYGSGYALRFPRFSRLREEKPPEDANTIRDVERLYRMQS